MVEIKVNLPAEDKKMTISKHIYGHFSEHLGRCIYDGFYVGEDSPLPNKNGIRTDIIEALKEIKIPNLRWPGGCFADEYHWMDGIGPKSERPEMINTHWGGVVESNHFGTHEFMDLCAQLECEPYICGNLGSGTVKEMQQWAEYLTTEKGPMAKLRMKNGRNKPWKIKFWGVGNENWGCGGTMTSRYYSDEFYRFSTYLRNTPTNKLYKIACGPNGMAGERHVTNWLEAILKKGAAYFVLGTRIHGISLHYYTTIGDWDNKVSATEFSEEDWYKTMQSTITMDLLIEQCEKVMDKFDPDKKIGLIVDEWGLWSDVEPGTNPGFLYQQNAMRDALVAAINLDIFNNHCERVHAAQIAQTINVLQAMILTEKEKMILTPTYHIFNMYKVHQDAELLPIDIEPVEDSFHDIQVNKDKNIEILHGSASQDGGGKVHITLNNLSLTKEVDSIITLPMEFSTCTCQILRNDDMKAHNTFENPDIVKPSTFTEFKLNFDKINIKIPTMSVLMLELSNK